MNVYLATSRKFGGPLRLFHCHRAPAIAARYASFAASSGNLRQSEAKARESNEHVLPGNKFFQQSRYFRHPLTNIAPRTSSIAIFTSVE